MEARSRQGRGPRSDVEEEVTVLQFRSSSGFENSGWGKENANEGTGRQMAPFGQAGAPWKLALGRLLDPSACCEGLDWEKAVAVKSLSLVSSPLSFL